MRHPWSVPVLLALGALAGYAMGARRVQAQAQTFPFQTGDSVIFVFQDTGTRACLIEEVNGTFARCGNAPGQPGPTWRVGEARRNG
jgi:hypothetical protein